MSYYDPHQAYLNATMQNMQNMQNNLSQYARGFGQSLNQTAQSTSKSEDHSDDEKLLLLEEI